MGTELEMQDTEVFGVAEAQHGVVSRAEVSSMTPRRVQYRVARGRWHRELPGVYRMGGAPSTWESQVTGMLRWASTTAPAYASHQTAARIHGIEEFKASTTLELSVRRCLRAKHVTVHRVASLTHHDTETKDGFAVTTVARTLLDLAGALDDSTLERCVDDALRKKKVTLEQLQQVLSRSSGRRGVRTLQRLVSTRRGDGGPTESRLEEVGLEIIAEAGLPKPEKQVRVRLSRKRARVDLMYLREKIVVELDGYATHSDVRSFEEDRTRANGLVRRGYTVLRWTWKAVHDWPHDLTTELRDVLASRLRPPWA